MTYESDRRVVAANLSAVSGFRGFERGLLARRWVRVF
jgi:hypothetical protein